MSLYVKSLNTREMKFESYSFLDIQKCLVEFLYQRPFQVHWDKLQQLKNKIRIKSSQVKDYVRCCIEIAQTNISGLRYIYSYATVITIIGTESTCRSP